jgi:HAD superfamily hydrolase (TIGR01549 family)
MSPTPVTAVVFDLDGTLVDTMTSAPEVYVATIRAIGGPDVCASDVVAIWHIGATAAVLHHFLARPISSADLDCYHRHFEAAMSSVRRFPGVVPMLNELFRRDYHLGIFTGANKRAALHILRSSGLQRYFRAVVGSDEVSAPKPASVGLQLACRRLGIAPQLSAYVGDTAIDLACARGAGSVAIHARWSAYGRELPGDCLIARHPTDVVRLLNKGP